jgi:hypothetical protein
MKESKVLRRNIYIVVMPLAILISIWLTINTINSIHVLKAGKVINATLIKKSMMDVVQFEQFLIITAN